VICGTRGVPGTVAPFRAWRGSRDLVAQSPKLHAPAVASFVWLPTKILTQRCKANQNPTRRPIGLDVSKDGLLVLSARSVALRHLVRLWQGFPEDVVSIKFVRRT